jgi:hypothetical protein
MRMMVKCAKTSDRALSKVLEVEGLEGLRPMMKSGHSQRRVREFNVV